MRSNLLGAILAVLAVALCGSASTRADDVQFSSFGVKPTSYDPSVPYELGAIRSAFLTDNQDQPVKTASAESGVLGGRLRRLQRHDANNGNTSCDGGPSGESGSTCPTCSSSECGSACSGSSPSLFHLGSSGSGSPGCGDACDCGSSSDCDAACACCDTSNVAQSLCYSEVQIMWLRAHVMEDAVDKLSEQYKFSPRFIVGYEDPCGIGARARYWHYNHETDFLGDDEGLRLKMDVLDVEATSRFAMRKTDLVVSGGMRWAHLASELDGRASGAEMPGLTFAADLRTQLCGSCRSQFAAIAGGRWSALGGDWEGSDDAFIPAVRDDNMVVQELYAGVEYTCHTCSGHDLYARLTFEIQNWHSDAASQLSGTDSIGFVGPGIHFGASF